MADAGERTGATIGSRLDCHVRPHPELETLLKILRLFFKPENDILRIALENLKSANTLKTKKLVEHRLGGLGTSLFSASYQCDYLCYGILEDKINTHLVINYHLM